MIIEKIIIKCTTNFLYYMKKGSLSRNLFKPLRYKNYVFYLKRWVAVYNYFELLLSCLVIWENAHRCIFGIQSAAYLIWHFQCHIIIVCQMSPHCLHIAFTWYVINIFREIGYTMILHLYGHAYIGKEKQKYRFMYIDILTSNHPSFQKEV